MPSTHSQQKTLKRDPQSLRRIETEEEYEFTIARIEALWDAAPDSVEAKTRDILVKFVEEYEERYEDLT